jgi:hypothetical protein
MKRKYLITYQITFDSGKNTTHTIFRNMDFLSERQFRELSKEICCEYQSRGLDTHFASVAYLCVVEMQN